MSAPAPPRGIAFLRSVSKENPSITQTTCPCCFKVIASSPDRWILDCADRAHSCPQLEIARLEIAEAGDPIAARMFRAQLTTSRLPR